MHSSARQTKPAAVIPLPNKRPLRRKNSEKRLIMSWIW
nr:MAG TPA: hypothetical protein [Caudoviricetes sp.]